MTETDRGAEEAAVLAAADSLITAFGHDDVERYFAAFRLTRASCSTPIRSGWIL